MRRRDFLGSIGIAAPPALSATTFGAETNGGAPVKGMGALSKA